MPAPIELLQTVCPCGCRSPVLVDAGQTAAGVTCPATQRRYLLPAGRPVKLRFGRKQWDACRDVRLLRQALAHLRRVPTARQRRLVAVGLAERCFGWCKNPAFKEAVAAGREFAKRGTTGRDLDALVEQFSTLNHPGGWPLLGLCCLHVAPPLSFGEVEAAYPNDVADLVKEIVPNPFRPPAVAPEWRTADVLGLAAAIYEREAWADCPVLADALEEAGSNDRPMLDHLRGPGPHALGCWVVDELRAAPGAG